MKKSILTVFALSVFIGGLIGCAPTASQLKKTMEDNPEILFAVIEKHPDEFLEVVNKAAREAQMRAQKKKQEDQEKIREDEFSNPKEPKIGENRAIFGPKDAPITIVEFTDLQCPYCARGYQTVQQVREEYGDKVRLVIKHLPLDFHPMAMPAAKMFEAIALQDKEKAYEWHAKVFENQNKLKKNGEEWMTSLAKDLGVDVAKMKKDMASDKVEEIVESDIAEARKFGFTGTPGFLINGVSLKGAYPFSEFKKVIDRHLEDQKG